MMNGHRDFDKILLTLGVLLSSGLVIFAALRAPMLLDWAKLLAANIFGGWLIVLQAGKKNGPNPPAAA